MTEAQTQAIAQIAAARIALTQAETNITTGTPPSLSGAAGNLKSAAQAVVVAAVYVGQAQRGG